MVGGYPLYIAAANGRDGIVSRLLQMKHVDVNATGSAATAVTPLWVACDRCQSGVVALLLGNLPIISLQVKG